MEENSENIKLNACSKRKISSLQGLRGVLFLNIFFFHSLLQCWVVNGAFAVSAFFVLSGFVLSYSHLYNKKEMQSPFYFAQKKIKKLYPLHVLFLLVGILPIAAQILLKKESLEHLYGLIRNFILDLLLLQSWVPSQSVYFSINGVSWFLSTCAFLYFCFPVFSKYMQKWQKNKTAIIWLIVFVLFDFLLSVFSFYFDLNDNRYFNTHWLTYILPAARLADFFIGCCLGYLFLNSNIHLQKKHTFIYSILEIFTVILCLVCMYLYHIPNMESVKYVSLFIIPVIFLVFLTAQSNGIISKVLSSKLLVRLGNLSPYLFIIHVLVISYTGTFNKLLLNSKANALVETVFAFVVSIILAVIWEAIMKKTHAKASPRT